MVEGLERIYLLDRKIPLLSAWASAFAVYPEVQVISGDYRQLVLDYDCVVAPANCFGLMDGGFDELIVEKFPGVMQRVQKHIADRFRGEQPVGSCLIVETGHERHPFIAHAPTMRVPMSIEGTDHVYLAMRAVLLAVHEHNAFFAGNLGSPHIRTLLIPGLGAGTGHVPPQEVAKQMALAYRSMMEPLPETITWDYADARQRELAHG